MSEVSLFLRVKIDDVQVAKLNERRRRLGRQARTGTEEVVNHVVESLQHNLMFEQVAFRRSLVCDCGNRDDEDVASLDQALPTCSDGCGRTMKHV